MTENNYKMEEEAWCQNMRGKLILSFIVFVVFGIATGIIITCI